MPSSTCLRCALFALTLTACFRVVDLDKYREAAPSTTDGTITTGETSDSQSVKLALVAMKPHVGQMIEIRVVDARNFVQSRAVISAMASPDATLHLPFSVPKPNGPYHLDFYADLDFSGGYDGIGSVLTNDHAWRIDPLEDYPEGTPATPGTIQVSFVHNTSFTDIDQYPSGTPNKSKDTGLDAAVHVSGLDGLQGKLAQLRIADRGSGHVVATYRVPQVRGSAFDAVVRGCVEQGTDYNVDLYVDGNGNGTYDDPSKPAGDLGWRAEATSDETGLAAQVDAANAAVGKVAVGEP